MSTTFPASTGSTLGSMRSPTWRYGFAILSTTIAAILTYAIRSQAHVWQAISAFLAAILLTGWHGGARPAALALVLSVFFDWWLLKTFDRPSDGLVSLVLRYSWFLLFAVMAAHFGTTRSRAYRRVQAARDHLEEEVAQRTHELRRIRAYLEDAERLSRVACWAMSLGEDPSVYWSEGVYEILGVPKGSSPARLDLVDTLVHPDDRDRRRRIREEALRERKPFELEFRIIRPDGTLRHLRGLGHPFPDSGAVPAEYLGVVMDVTELRRSERMLVEAQRLAHVGNWEFNIETGQVSWSEETRRILGLPEGILSRGYEAFCEFVHPDDRAVLDEARARLTRGETGFRVEYRIIRPGGEVRHIVKNVELIRDLHGRPYIGFGAFQDVTELRDAERSLHLTTGRLRSLSRRLLEVQEEERRHLARELHDEFGQLLAAISLHLHSAKKEAGEPARAHIDESMTLIQSAAAQVRGLALELRPAMLETSGLDATLRWLAQQHGQRSGLSIEVVGSVDPVADEVAVALFRVAQEALTNVSTHARAQHVRIELHHAETTVEMEVRDDGVGFDVSESLDRLPAERGLGLLGMRERAEILGGRLDMESEPGRGTSVRISLPIGEEASDASEAPR